MNNVVNRLELPGTRTQQRPSPLPDALKNLDPLHQRFIALKFFQHLTTPEIARVLDCSEANVKLIQYHALKALQGRVAP